MSAHFVELLDELLRRSLRMASQVEDIVQEACEAVLQSDDALARRVLARDAEIDKEEVEVESEVVRLMALYQPVGIDLRVLCAVLKVNNDLERIADCAVNVAERARHLEPHDVNTDPPNLGELYPLVRRILRNAVRAYSTHDAETARNVVIEDEGIDALYAQMVQRVVATASAAPGDIAAHLDVLSVAKNLERIADHATNIAEDVIYLKTGEIVRHRVGERQHRGARNA